MRQITQPGNRQSANTQELTPFDSFRREINRMRTQFKNALPPHIDPARFERVVITAIQGNPDLLRYDRSSLLGSCMMAAQLGLLTDGFLGQAHLVPFKGRVQLIVGYKGLLQLVRQTNEIKSVDVDTIHENDDVTLVAGDESVFKVVADWRDRGPIIGVYAIAHFKNGGVQRAIMSVEEVNRIRDASKGANSGPWKSHWAEMAKKTVFRRLCKWLPLSVEAQQATAVEDAADAGTYVTLNQDGDVVPDTITEDAPPTNVTPLREGVVTDDQEPIQSTDTGIPASVEQAEVGGHSSQEDGSDLTKAF